MRVLTTLTATVAFLVSSAPLSDGAEARSCYEIWAEADGSEGHYRHFVYVENDCEEWLQCTLWTDVDPQPPKLVSVAPGATESEETNGRSQYDDPRGFGNCHFK